MKRIIAITLSLAIILSFTACSKKTVESKSGFKVEESLFNVTVTVPASFFEEDETEEQIRKEAEENSFKSCTINEDGSVTYVMTKSQRKNYLKKYKETMNEGFQELIEEEDSSFDKIEANNDLTEFTVYVNDNYSEWDAFTVLYFYIQGSIYQLFNGVQEDDIDMKVKFIKSSNNETVLETSYKEFTKANEDITIPAEDAA